MTTLGRSREAETVANRRERAQGAEKVTGIKATRGGSSGITNLLRRVEKHVWEDIEPDTHHIADFVGWIQTVNVSAQRTITVTISVPIDYMQEVANFADASTLHFAYLRGYVVPRPSFMAALDDGDDDALGVT